MFFTFYYNSKTFFNKFYNAENSLMETTSNKVWTLDEIKKDPDQILPDFQKYLKLLDEGEDDGWNVETKGQIGDIKDTYLEVHSKTIDNQPLLFLKLTGEMKDVDVDKFIRMLDDLELKKQWDERCKGGDAIAFFPGEGKLFTIQLKMPFPLTDRDSVEKRHAICNKLHPDLVKKYGLPEKDNKYWFIVIEPIKLKGYEETSDFVRATFTLVFLAEELSEKPGFISLKGVMHNDAGGMIPNFLVNFLAGKLPSRMFAQIYESYFNMEKKGIFDKVEAKKEKLYMG